MVPGRILIIQTAFIGDVILATALVEKLAEKIPGVTIDFLVRRGNEVLLQNNPHIRVVRILDKKRKKYVHVYKMIREIRSQNYDLVVNLQRFFTTGLITVLSGARKKVGFDKNPWSFMFNGMARHQIGREFNKHEVQRNQELIKEYTDDQPGKPKLYLSDDQIDKVQPYLGADFITISPASVWFTKQYPKEQWIEFMVQVNESVQIYLLGGPDDLDYCEGIKDVTQRSNVVNLAGKLDLLQSAALMKAAKMNYVNDSAPLHLASAINAPVTAIFCSTIPEFGFGPLSDQSVVLQTSEDLSCRPCGLHGHHKCPEGHFKCAQIDTRHLLDQLH